MPMIDKRACDERRRALQEGVKTLEASGAPDDLYEKIDAGTITLG